MVNWPCPKSQPLVTKKATEGGVLGQRAPDIHGSPVMPPTVSVLCRGLVWRGLATITRPIGKIVDLWDFRRGLVWLTVWKGM